MGWVEHKHVGRSRSIIACFINGHYWGVGFKVHDWGIRFLLGRWHYCFRFPERRKHAAVPKPKDNS